MIGFIGELYQNEEFLVLVHLPPLWTFTVSNLKKWTHLKTICIDYRRNIDYYLIMLIHPISPVYDKNSKILILGSFPSVRSREEGFFYGHPQNRFWKTVATIYEEDTPHSIEEKKAFLHRNQIALWDVIRSCEIEGSSDASIKNVIPNDLNIIFKEADIRQIYVNGKTALKYYQRYIEPNIGRTAVCLPSTSPANASYNVERLLESWKQIRIL